MNLYLNLSSNTFSYDNNHEFSFNIFIFICFYLCLPTGRCGKFLKKIIQQIVQKNKYCDLFQKGNFPLYDSIYSVYGSW